MAVAGIVTAMVIARSPKVSWRKTTTSMTRASAER